MVYLNYLRAPGADRREMSRLGRELLRKLVSCAGEGAEGLEIKTDDNGRPFFDKRENLDFSISHSKELVVCALSVDDGRVGVDTEMTESTVCKEKQPAFSKRFFSGNERDALSNGAESFSEIWTKKEAYLKREGTGLATDLREVDTCRMPENVRFEVLRIEDHIVTVCLSSEAELIQI